MRFNAKQLTQAAVSASSSGDNTLVAAVASQKTRAYRFVLVSAGTVSVKFKRGSTDLTGAMPLVANQVLSVNLSAEPYFETGTNEALILNLSGAVAVTGWIEYLTA